MFNAIGQCGSILGSHIFPKTEGPRYMYVTLSPGTTLAHVYLAIAEEDSQVRFKIMISLL
jgi:hypothetical protein